MISQNYYKYSDINFYKSPEKNKNWFFEVYIASPSQYIWNILKFYKFYFIFTFFNFDKGRDSQKNYGIDFILIFGNSKHKIQLFVNLKKINIVKMVEKLFYLWESPERLIYNINLLHK